MDERRQLLQKLDIPAAVRQQLDLLRAAGGRPLLVGGVVRDALLDQASMDFDVATALRPEELAGILPAVDPVLGASHQVLEGADFTVTTFRRDACYDDQRHPSRVTFVATAAADAARRDFTINALYADPWSRELLDPVGGMQDLADRVLRVIGDADERLREDPLRILRAVRFAARFDLRLARDTEVALRNRAAELGVLSQERVFQELTAAFTGPGRGRALELLVDLDLAEHVLPEVCALRGVEQPPEFHPEGDVHTHVCMVLDEVPPDDPTLAWAAVLHDVGKPATFERHTDRIRFHGHDSLSAEMAETALHRLRAPRELRETVVEVCRDHIRFAAIQQMKTPRRERWMRSPRFPAHLEFHRADCAGSHGKLGIYEWARELWRELPPEPPPALCTGADVLALGVEQGPMVGEVLRELSELVEELGVPDRDSALRHLSRIVDERFRPPQ